MNTNTYTIGQVSKLTGLPAKTIRYYEEIELISPATRAENGYRSYTQSSLEELILLKSARDLGLPIKEIKKLMIGCTDNCNHAKETVQQDLAGYLESVTDQIDQLTSLKTKLEKLQTKIKTDGCDSSNLDYCCNYLRQLVDIEKQEGVRKMSEKDLCCGGSCSCDCCK